MIVRAHLGTPTGPNSDYEGDTIERTFNGDTRVNGERVAYETWPLLENPWMRQEFGGNLTLTEGRTTRVHDVQNWTTTEVVQPGKKLARPTSSRP
jgi:hypothetical protein